MQDKEKKALVFDIQRFSIHDGPGIRTTVFFKGCNLHCPWCHNPESVNPFPELMFYPGRCLKCFACVDRCRHEALLREGEDILYVPEKCRRCFNCADVCPGGALTRSGSEMGVEEIFEEVMKDKSFYETSGGGVTASGGEPLLQPEFVAYLFKMLKRENIPTCIETAGNVPWKNFGKILPVTDLFLYDVKSGNVRKLRDATGADMQLVSGNLEKLLLAGKEVFIRIPVIPGFNADLSDLREMLSLLESLPVQNFKTELLKYNGLGTSKYLALKRPCPFKEISGDEAEKAYGAALEFFNKAGYGIRV